MLDILFLVLIAVFVPIIVFVGMKIYDYKNIRKVVIALTFVFLALELLRFFCNARFYDNATTPKGDVKFVIVTVLCIFSLFATFNNNKYLGNLMRNVFILTALAPIITAIFYPITYINALDVNGVCKAFYMLECGFTLTLALLYVKERDIKVHPWYLLWSSLFVVLYAGVNALTIYYWTIDIALNWLWYVSWVVVLATVLIVYGVNRLYYYLKEKHTQQKNNE